MSWTIASLRDVRVVSYKLKIMSVIDIQNAFFTEGRSVYDFFQRPGVGFYIPIFQRDYSWDKDNVEQLLEDITKGVSAMIESENEIRFLGTIITVQEKDRRRIQPLELPGLPATIDKIIDGQQRLSTIALFATQLYKYFDYIENRFNKNSQYAGLNHRLKNHRSAHQG